MKYGKLTFISNGKTDACGRQRWICKCECGAEKEFDAYNVKSGKSKSCGCLRNKLSKERNTKHGMSCSRTYNIWIFMIQRCNNKNLSEYPRYGARDITVCDRWLSFENFLADMGECPSGYSIERRKNDRGYKLSNCKWATPKEQARNRRSNRWITHDGRTQLLIDWADELNMTHGAILGRLRRGWSVEKALSTPKGK